MEGSLDQKMGPDLSRSYLNENLPILSLNLTFYEYQITWGATLKSLIQPSLNVNLTSFQEEWSSEHHNDSLYLDYLNFT